MPMREGKPPYGDENRAEDKKHWGERGEGSEGEHHKGVANIPANTEGSELVENCGMGHAKQPHGTGIGAGTTDIAEHHKPSRMGSPHTFRAPELKEAHTFSGSHKSGYHRLSGHSGAHMVGKRK